jgi:hypothetical protein
MDNIDFEDDVSEENSDVSGAEFSDDLGNWLDDDNQNLDLDNLPIPGFVLLI